MPSSWRFPRERLTLRPGALRLSLLDIKLAGRMIRKYPGVTIVGGLAIATAIAVTTVAFEITHDFSSPALPLAESSRIVTLQMWDGRSNGLESRLMSELAEWRRARSLEHVGGYDTVERNLVAGGGEGELVRVAEMTASGFRVAAVAPLLGRTLVDADEADGAPAVAVIGHALWQTRFNADPNIVGRTLHLGVAPFTIVGVMPPGFGFPVSHSLWIPLAMRENRYERFQGPSVHAFARLRASVTLAGAEAELKTISARQPVDPAAAPAPMRPRVLPYAMGLLEPGLLDRAYLLQSLLVIILLICCANVATLVFARTATRQSEIVVRTALGASRGRILGQFFAEALVLASIGAATGLALANGAIQWTMQLIWSSGNPKPFWWDDHVAPVTYVYAAGLTVVAAIVCGIIPALKGTRAGLHAALQDAAGRGASLKFGAGWTAIIVLQVALCVALLPAALSQAWDATRAESGGVGFASNEYLSVILNVEAGSASRRATILADFAGRVRQEPGVESVTFAERFPGMDHARGPIEVDGAFLVDRELPNAQHAVVTPGFFGALNVRALTGRVFVDADVRPGHRVAVVNRLFVDRILNGGNAVGRRVRFATSAPPQPWMEIIGVVPDLGMNPLRPDEGAGLYLAAAADDPVVNRMAVHLAGDPTAFAARLRAIALEVDPALQLKAPTRLDVVASADQRGFRFFSFALLAIAAVGILLATSGIYAMMSFTVSRRTREIAIRAALGANPRRLVAAIFSRAVLQISLGAMAGVAMVLAARPRSAREIWLPAGLAVVMLIIGVFACAAPARRALAIEPSDALKDIG